MHPVQRRIRVLLIATIAVWLTLVGTLRAEKTHVTTKDGKHYEGELLAEDDQKITIEVGEELIEIKRSEILSRELVPDVAKEYQQRRAKLRDDDLRGRFDLAKWLLTKRSYELAERELADIAERSPDDAKVKQLLEVVRKRLELRAEGNDEAPGKLRNRRLTNEQINIIKVYEIDLKRPRHPKVVVPNDVTNEFIERYAEQEPRLRGRQNLREFKRASGDEKLALIFELKARELYPRVQVRGDPLALATFRRTVHRQYVLNYCGTTKCHGKPETEGFKLFAKRPSDDATVYTNYYLLHTYAEGKGFMIDRDRPESSYLVQYGLPRVDASTPHPEAEGWQPKFRRADMPLQRQLTDWIEQLNNDPVPEYPIEYPPRAKPDEEKGGPDDSKPAPRRPARPRKPGADS